MGILGILRAGRGEFLTFKTGIPGGPERHVHGLPKDVLSVVI